MALESAMKTLMLLPPEWLGQHPAGNNTLLIRVTDAHCIQLDSHNQVQHARTTDS